MFPLWLTVPAGQASLNIDTLLLIFYAGIMASIVLPCLWIKGIEHLGPNRCSTFMNALPVITAGLAITLLHERLAWYHVVGGSIALLGVFIAQTLRIRIWQREPE